MLAAGGNAIDAAIATSFALTVVEPMSVGFFGSGFVNLCKGTTGEITTLDNYTVAPTAARPDMYEPVSDTWPDYMEAKDRKNRVGHLAVAVPGALKSWCYVQERFGKLSLEDVMQPAIRYAGCGFPASPHLVEYITEVQEDIARFPDTAKVFLPNGAPLAPGQTVLRPEYAHTLEAISREGSAYLYDGDLGRAVVEDMERNGGLITMEDLRRYEVKNRPPVRGTFHGYEIVAPGPTSCGGSHIIQALNILEEFDLRALGFGTVRYFHLLAEVLKIVFADRYAFMGDPDVVDIPLDWLTDKGYAALRRREVDMEQAREYSAGEPGSTIFETPDTTHLTTMDNEGNVVSMTQTIHETFGSKVTTPGTGMLLNNTMYLFDPHPGQPNSIAPGKRQLSYQSPVIVLKDGRPFMALGTPGGSRIFAAVLQAIVNVIAHGMTLQEAVEAPRIWTQGQELLVEQDVPRPVMDGLAAMGHQIEVVPKVAGGMNGVLVDPDSGLMHGAACWRADGAPIGISGGQTRPGLGAGSVF
jgi:gamma-glutamyltranspeptidase/glutathione hydrolase